MYKRQDANGWETYSELPPQRFQHQYFDDTNLIKNMVFDIDVPTIGAMSGPGFPWDSAFLCDVTLVSDDCRIEVPHAQGGLVPGDGMGLMFQHYLGTKRGNYYMTVSYTHLEVYKRQHPGRFAPRERRKADDIPGTDDNGIWTRDGV